MRVPGITDSREVSERLHGKAAESPGTAPQTRVHLCAGTCGLMLPEAVSDDDWTGETVLWITDPFQREIHEEEVWDWWCGDCFYDRKMEV